MNLIQGTELLRNKLNNIGALLTFYFLFFFFRFGKPQWRACSAYWCSVGSGGPDWLTPVAFRFCRRHVSALESHVKVTLTKQLLSRTRQVQSLFANSFAAGCRIYHVCTFSHVNWRLIALKIKVQVLHKVTSSPGPLIFPPSSPSLRKGWEIIDPGSEVVHTVKLCTTHKFIENVKRKLTEIWKKTKIVRGKKRRILDSNMESPKRRSVSNIAGFHLQKLVSICLWPKCYTFVERWCCDYKACHCTWLV